MGCIPPAEIAIGEQNQLAVSRIHVRDLESTEILISSHGLIVSAPVVVLWIVIFGILGTTILSDSVDIYTSCATGVVIFCGKSQYCTRSDTRNAIAKRLRIRSLSMIESGEWLILLLYFFCISFSDFLIEKSDIFLEFDDMFSIFVV